MSFHLNESKLRSIIREELIRSLSEGASGEDAYAPPKGSSSPLVKLMDSFIQRARDAIGKKYSNVIIDKASLWEDSSEESYQATLCIAVTGADQKTLGQIAEQIRSMGGLPGNVKFVPGVTFTKSNDLIGDSWRRSLLSRRISGDQPAAVLRTNTPGARVSPD